MRTDYDVANDPWLLPPSGPVVDKAITEALPPNISVTLGILIYVEEKDLSDVFLGRLMRLAAFQNPEFYRPQAMRLSTFDKPPVIACAEDFRHQIVLPRGLLKHILDLFDSHRIVVKATDHGFGGVPVEFRSLKELVGACGFEPQTPTVSTPSLLRSHSA